MPPVPSASRRLEFIDSCRGLGLLSVLFYHSALKVVGEPMRWDGWLWDPAALPAGVSILNLVQQTAQAPTMFFVISGYLMHRSLTKLNGEGLGFAIVRRGLRLYVPYLIVLGLFALVWPWTRIEPNAAGITDALLHGLLAFNFNPTTLYSINASFWYVATELQLCALYPAVLMATRRWGWGRVMSALLAVELGVRVIGSMVAAQAGMGDLGSGWLTRSFGGYLFTWYLGAWVAQRQIEGRGTWPGAGVFWTLVATTVATTVVLPLTGMAPLFAALCYAFGLAWLIARPAAAAPTTSGAARAGWLRGVVPKLGSVSLGVYLLNQPLVREMQPYLEGLPPSPLLRITVTAMIALAICAPAAWLMSRLIERPVCRMFDAWLLRFRDPKAIDGRTLSR